MKYLLDTANLDAIRYYTDIFPIAGVTSNPSIVKKEGKIDFFAHMNEIRSIIGMDKTLHIQVTALDTDGILRDADTILKKVDDQVCIKVPVTLEGLKAIKALIHGMSRPIGALFHVAHGLSNAMLMKECLSFALEGAYDRFADLGRAIGVATPEDSDQAASEKFLDAVVALTEELETPTLAEFGIDKEKFFEVIEKMAYDAMDSGSPQNTQRTITQADVEQMYKNLW